MANSASQGQHHCVVVMKQENLGMAYSCDWDYRGFLVLIKLLMALSCCKGVGGSFFFSFSRNLFSVGVCANQFFWFGKPLLFMGSSGK